MVGLTLNIAEIVDRTHVLGPGCRFAIWTQGCPHSCPGCVAPEFIPRIKARKISLPDLLARISGADGLEGVTVSGGEPLLQAEAVAELLYDVRHTLGLSSILYTGYSTQEVGRMSSRSSAVRRAIENADVVIDGRYEHALNDSRGLRGSSNQNIHFISPRYRDRRVAFESCIRGQEQHAVEDGSMLVGLPSLSQWRRIVFGAAGH